MLVLLKEDNTTLLFNFDLLELDLLSGMKVLPRGTVNCMHCYSSSYRLLPLLSLLRFSGKLCSANLKSMFILQNLKVQFTIGLQLRTCLTSALYKKALVLAPQARQETTVGQVISFLSHTSSVSEIH